MTAPQHPAHEALALLSAGRPKAARDLALSIAAASTTDGFANLVAATTLYANQQFEDALPYARRAAEARPRDGDALECYCAVLRSVGKLTDALAVARQWQQVDPASRQAVQDIVECLQRLDRPSELITAAREAMKHFPNDLRLEMALAGGLMEQGRASEAARILDQAVRREPLADKVVGFAATASNFVHPADKRAIIAAHRRYGELLDRHAPPPKFTHLPPPEDDRIDAARFKGSGRDGRLRVAFLSADLRDHSVAFFLRPILEHLSPDRFETLCFYNHLVRDDTNARIRALVRPGPGREGFFDIHGMHFNDLANLIHDQSPDILFDLNGLFEGSRSDVFHLFPAPVQATFCGYPNTTGMSRVHWRLVDSITDPPGTDDRARERLLRLDPCFLCYRPPEEAPEVSTRSDPHQPITFGSFNRVVKLNDAVIRVWSAILKRVPSAKLIIKSGVMDDPATRQDFAARFAAAGAPPDSVELVGRIADRAGHMGLYRRVDIALDTFPYAGTTTTCEALYMGVPVITLAEPQAMHAARVGASLLSALSLPELIATSEKKYIDTAVALANDPARLADLRAGMRQRLLASPLCDAPAYARRFEAALESIWTDWCHSDKPQGLLPAGVRRVWRGWGVYENQRPRPGAPA
jgi:protein O-GlcNAc transferase